MWRKGLKRWLSKRKVMQLECDTSLKYKWNICHLSLYFIPLTDMSIYGHCPAHDDFFLVVCSHCSQVVKPQAFERHCERRHGPFSKLYGPSSSCSPDRPQQGRPPSRHPGICEVQDKKSKDAGPQRIPPPHSPHQCRFPPQCKGHRWESVSFSFALYLDVYLY